MAATPPTKTARDKNLDALQKAANEWFTKEERRLDNETKFLRAVLQGRGQAAAKTQNLEKIGDVVVQSINDFVTTGSGT